MRQKKRNISGIIITLSVIAALSLIVSGESFGFVGPQNFHPITIGQPDNSGALIQVDPSRRIYIGGQPSTSSLFFITASDQSPNNYGFIATDADNSRIFRIRNDGAVGFGPIDLRNPNDFTNSTYPPDNPKDSYIFQIERLIVPDPYKLAIASSTYYQLDTSTTNIFIKNWNVTSTATKTGSLEGIAVLNPTITNFASLINIGSLNSQVPASSVTPGVFGADYGAPTFVFDSTARIGVNTSTNVGIPENLSVYGSGYLSGGVDIRSVAGNGPGRINVSSINAWNSAWKKAIRINDTSLYEGMGFNGSAIQFGGGGTSPFYGVTWSNVPIAGFSSPSFLYFFKTNSEFSTYFATDNLFVVGSDNSSIGSALPSPDAVLAVKGYSGSDSIQVGRKTSVSSIQADPNSRDISLNSTSSGALYLNNFTSGNVIIGVGGGNLIGINTALPSALLDVNGKLKAQAVRITGGSPAAGKILKADGSSGLSSWGTAPMPSGATGQTLRHNGTGWIGTSNLFKNGNGVGVGATNLPGVNSLHVAGGISVGSYAGASAAPTDGFIASGNVMVGVLSGYPSPVAKLDVLDDTIILRGNGGSVKLFVQHGSSPGDSLCTSASSNGAICLAGFKNGARHNSACKWNVGTVDVICADFND